MGKRKKEKKKKKKKTTPPSKILKAFFSVHSLGGSYLMGQY